MVIRVYVSGISGNKEVSNIHKIAIQSQFKWNTHCFETRSLLSFATRNHMFLYDFNQVKKRQQRVTMILDSKNIKYDLIDIAEPGKESDKQFMQENSKTRESKHPLPPQIFNDDRYCGVSMNYL